MPLYRYTSKCTQRVKKGGKMHFHLQTLHRTTTRYSKYNVNSIVRLLLKLCPPKKQESTSQPQEFAGGKRENSQPLLSAPSKLRLISSKNDTLFSKKRYVTFNKTTRCFQQNDTSLSTKVICCSMHTTRWRTSNT